MYLCIIIGSKLYHPHSFQAYLTVSRHGILAGEVGAVVAGGRAATDGD